MRRWEGGRAGLIEPRSGRREPGDRPRGPMLTSFAPRGEEQPAAARLLPSVRGEKKAFLRGLRDSGCLVPSPTGMPRAGAVAPRQRARASGGSHFGMHTRLLWLIRRAMLVCLIAALAALALAACGGSAAGSGGASTPARPVISKDALGNPISIPATAPRRIVS